MGIMKIDKCSGFSIVGLHHNYIDQLSTWLLFELMIILRYTKLCIAHIFKLNHNCIQ